MVVLTSCLIACCAIQQAEEARYYEIIDIEIPQEVVLEVGGISQYQDDHLLVSTRRGEVWQVSDYRSSDASFQMWTEGLQVPLGLLDHDGWMYSATRGSLQKMRDSNGDGRADQFRTVCDAWTISGNYHEYNFGPRIDPQGNFWVTTNKPFGAEPFGRVDWRGWAMKITPEGKMVPFAAGLRSPAGIEVSPWGEPFYTDNQGEWCGASKLAHIEAGDFHGHPHGIDSAKLPGSLVTHPGKIPDGIMMADAAKEIPSFKLPAVWFPYDKMGRSPSGMAWDQSVGTFGPFTGQLFVGDQYSAELMRVFLEEVDGHWQGACFPFRHGFATGIIRVRQMSNGEMVLGGSDRGWAAVGGKPWALQRLRWTGEMPFEILTMKATPDGFELEFTEAIDGDSLASASFEMSSYSYELHSAYGSDELDTAELQLGEVTLGANGRSLSIPVEGLRAGYVHELHIEGMRNAAGEPLLHGEAYYTLARLARAD